MTTVTEKKTIRPDRLSLTTHQLAICFKPTDNVLAFGTGFIYKHLDKHYLITNWHNVSGKNPFTYEQLADHAGVPDIFSTKFRDKNNPGTCHKIEINLYHDKEMTKPKWLVHPYFKEKVDVIAIELSNEIVANYSLYPINEQELDKDVVPEISDIVFVIGYPFNEPEILELPIWKKGSIATEPTVDRDQSPKLLIDTATRPGFSGSPVIYERTGIHGISMDSLIGRVRNFLGVYSGRLGKDEFQAQLGIVWKEKVIKEIIDGGKFDNIEFLKK